ncbi:hypothetical protein [Pleionea sediminis]|uniref:hypothetical protein n=1 Tax=Pleionea sediminis TaxID=2569479 RepID=UPI0013DE5887|nr:hypothetical protein [Pleionea sediminis]
MNIRDNGSSVSYSIFNQDTCWFIKLAENNVIGPYTSFKNAQNYAQTLSLLSEVKKVA